MVSSPVRDEEMLPSPATARSKGLRPALARVTNIGLSIVPNTTDQLKPVSKDKKQRFYRQHAPIWSLYIRDAAAQAKVHADHWNTTLDTLLIFVRFLRLLIGEN